jgi:hypothetical protein
LNSDSTNFHQLQEALEAENIIFAHTTKDVDLLYELGFKATCYTGDVDTWKNGDGEYFKGKRITLLHYNDDQSRQEMRQIASRLKPTAKEVKIGPLPVANKQNGGLEYVRQNFDSLKETADRLRFTIKSTKPYEMSDKERYRIETFGFIHNADILTGLKPIQWQIHGILEQNIFYYNFGDSGNYKTFVEIDRLLHIASGIDYHGHKVKQGTVFYIAGEGQQGIGRRILAWHIHHKTKARDIPFFVGRTPTQLMEPGAVEQVKRAVDQMDATYGQPAIVHIDTLARNFGAGDENSAKDMNRVISNLDTYFGNDIGRGLTHHTGHANKDRARGSYALHCAADAAYRIQYRADDNILVRNPKAKDAPPAADMLFKRVIIKLNIDGHHDSSIALELESEGDIPAEDQQKGMSNNMVDALTVLKKMYAECEKNLAHDGRAGQMPHISKKEWKSACIRGGIYSRTDNFDKGMNRLFERNSVAFDENQYHVYPIEIYRKYNNAET